MKQLQLYLIIGLLITSLGSGVAVKLLWDKKVKLEQQITQLEAAREKAASNLILVSEQLSRERQNREIAEAALLNLRSVPDEDYRQELPPSITNVLDDFHNRVRERMR